MTDLQRTAMQARAELNELRRRQEQARRNRAAARRNEQERAAIAASLRKLPIATLRQIATQHLQCPANTTRTSTAPT